MHAFFCKLVPPRPTFAQDMSAEETELMGAHAAYWRGHVERGSAVTFGVVADPAGVYGIAVVEVGDAAEVHRLTADDPVVRSGRGFRFDVHPMPRGAVHR